MGGENERKEGAMGDTIMGVGRESLFEWVQRQKEIALGIHNSVEWASRVSAASDVRPLHETVESYTPDLNGVYAQECNEDWALFYRELGGEG